MQALPTPRMTLGHMGIGCFDLDRMVDFYTNVLGFTATDRSNNVVFMTTDPIEHHQLALVKGRTEGEIRTDPVPGGSLGTAIFQVSFRLKDLATLRALKNRAEASGGTGFVVRNHGNAWAVYFRDPEGNAIELYVPTPWHINQPSGAGALDLDQTDEEIFASTEAFCKSHAGCISYDTWRQNMAASIERSQARLYQ